MATESAAEFTTLAAELSHTSLNKIIQRFSLREIGSPYLALHSPLRPDAPIGSLRLFTGGPIHKMVYVGMTVPAIKLDSHMIFAFTAPESPVPHFTVDSVFAADAYAFHVDVWTRVDLGANLAYMKEVMLPLTEEFNRVKNTEGLTPAHLEPHQWCVFSPWMMAWRADEDGFKRVRPSIDFFLDYWMNMVETGISAEAAEGLTPDYLRERDRRARNINFSKEIDPVWFKVDRLLGTELSDRMRNILRVQSLEEESGM